MSFVEHEYKSVCYDYWNFLPTLSIETSGKFRRCSHRDKNWITCFVKKHIWISLQRKYIPFPFLLFHLKALLKNVIESVNLSLMKGLIFLHCHASCLASRHAYYFYLGLAFTLSVTWSQTFLIVLSNLKFSAFFIVIQCSFVLLIISSPVVSSSVFSTFYSTWCLIQADKCPNYLSFVLLLAMLISFLIAMPTFLSFDLNSVLPTNSKVMNKPQHAATFLRNLSLVWF